MNEQQPPSSPTPAIDSKPPPSNSDEDAAASAMETSNTKKDTSPPEPAASAAADPNPNEPTKRLSKNQQKKRARYEKALANKKLRKSQQREIRHLKALHSGRNLEAERQQQLLNEQSGKGWERREEKWKQTLKNADIDNSFRVCFDCSFEESMTTKERNSLGLQLRYTYAVNRKSCCPVYIDVCSLKVGGETRCHLEKVVGFPDRWVGRAFNTHEAGLEEVYGWKGDKKDEPKPSSESDTIQKQDITINKSTNPKKKLVYLTGDSPNTLSTLSNDTTYIIGGIVDRNRLKNATIHRAQSLNIPTARLPLEENLDFKGSTRILTCNHVFEILLRFRENGYKDWKESILSVLPGRKEVSGKKDDEDDGGEDED